MSTSDIVVAIPAESPAAEREYDDSHAVEPEAGGAGSHEGIHLPPTSLWPITLALSITLMAAGAVNNFLVSIPGLLVFIWALRGWAKELMNAQH